MISLRTPIAAELIDPLEEWFSAHVRCPWGIHIELERASGRRSTGGAPACEVIGYFPHARAAEMNWKKLRAAFPTLPRRPARRKLADRDWRDAYKKHLRPWSCGDLHWVPVWLKNKYRLPQGHVRLLFDAGLAFGTGDHPTTRLMARRLRDFCRDRDGPSGCPRVERARSARSERARSARSTPSLSHARIIDAGCGSGILALSAALLGAKNIFAFDRDPEAIRVSRENLKANGLRPRAVKFAHAGIEAALQGRKADLLLANIQADVLAIHADDLAQAIAPGGTLALSGILAAEVETVRAAFRPVLKKIWKQNAAGDSRVMGDWRDLVFKRPAALP